MRSFLVTQFSEFIHKIHFEYLRSSLFLSNSCIKLIKSKMNPVYNENIIKNNRNAAYYISKARQLFRGLFLFKRNNVIYKNCKRHKNWQYFPDICHRIYLREHYYVGNGKIFTEILKWKVVSFPLDWWTLFFKVNEIKVNTFYHWTVIAA